MNIPVLTLGDHLSDIDDLEEAYEDVRHILPAKRGSILESNILKASRGGDYERGQFGPTKCPLSTWCSFSTRDAMVARRPEIMSFPPYNRAVTFTIVAYLRTASFTDDFGLPTPQISSTFSPVYEADRYSLYRILDKNSNLPKGCMPYRAPGADIRVERYLPHDSSQAATFRAFDGVFDGRGGYLTDHLGQPMPRIHPSMLKVNDLVVYATSVERYWLPQPDGYWNWVARLKLESITLLEHDCE
ncbi:hypothetical protein BV25DRAFT_1913065 [Artomyces pyxidatus]|uniref:Uncharacterized protein n=1 Tax=Artomyces pyxidatus TaxID=48021 RepID=A0ACB8TCI5_9AGAM|nr:hypothetical protein BV25DRAFT_1913065 [Artomyces pyxidatus]